MGEYIFKSIFIKKKKSIIMLLFLELFLKRRHPNNLLDLVISYIVFRLGFRRELVLRELVHRTRST